MTDSADSDALDELSSTALSCATAIRLGGALFILAEAAGVDDLYYRVDAGVQAGLRASGGRPLNADVMRIAVKAGTRLEAEYAGPQSTSAFVRSGFEVLNAVLRVVRGDAVRGSHADIFEKSVQAAALWPFEVDVDSFTSLPEFERSCQLESIRGIREGGVEEIDTLSGARALQYRRIAQSAVPRA